MVWSLYRRKLTSTSKMATSWARMSVLMAVAVSAVAPMSLVATAVTIAAKPLAALSFCIYRLLRPVQGGAEGPATGRYRGRRAGDEAKQQDLVLAVLDTDHVAKRPLQLVQFDGVVGRQRLHVLVVVAVEE